MEDFSQVPGPAWSTGRAPGYTEKTKKTSAKSDLDHDKAATRQAAVLDKALSHTTASGWSARKELVPDLRHLVEMDLPDRISKITGASGMSWLRARVHHLTELSHRHLFVPPFRPGFSVLGDREIGELVRTASQGIESIPGSLVEGRQLDQVFMADVCRCVQM